MRDCDLLASSPGNFFCGGVCGVGCSDEMQCRLNFVLVATGMHVLFVFFFLLSHQATRDIGGVVRVMGPVAAVDHVAQVLQIEQR